MDALEYEILVKREELRELLKYSLVQAPVYLPLIRQVKDEITLCDCALNQLYLTRARFQRA